jgi:hypothetical protein
MRRARMAILAVTLGMLTGALWPRGVTQSGARPAPLLAASTGDPGIAVLLTGVGTLLAVGFVASLLAKQLITRR